MILPNYHIVNRGENNNSAIHQDSPVHGGGNWMWCSWEETEYEDGDEIANSGNVDPQPPPAEREAAGRERVAMKAAKDCATNRDHIRCYEGGCI
jgi:hypothetical protein